MNINLRIFAALLIVSSSPMACGGEAPEMGTSSGQASAEAVASGACAPSRWDVVLEGRTCAALTRHTSKGSWSATPLFPDAPPAIRDSRCALVFLPEGPACKLEHPYGMLSLDEIRASAMRTAACAADASACEAHGTFATELPGTAPKEIGAHAKPDELTPSGLPTRANHVPSCDSCGVVSGGILYLTNPYGSSTIFVDLQTVIGTPVPTTLLATPYSSFAVDVGTQYSAGTVRVWQ